jgi:hypothetical protein
VTLLCRTSFDFAGGPVKVSRKVAEHFCQIVLPCRLGQSSSMVRLLAEMRCAVHNHETPLARKSIPPSKAVVANANQCRLYTHSLPQCSSPQSSIGGASNPRRPGDGLPHVLPRKGSGNHEPCGAVAFRRGAPRTIAELFERMADRVGRYRHDEMQTPAAGRLRPAVERSTARTSASGGQSRHKCPIASPGCDVPEIVGLVSGLRLAGGDAQQIHGQPTG